MATGLLAGKVVVVSGVGPGLGRHIVENAGAAGASVMMGARSVDFLDDLATQLKDKSVPAAYRRCDVTEPDDCRQLVAAAEDAFGAVDGIVCNQATSAPFGVTVEDADFDEWKQAFEVNLWGSLRLAQAAIPAMRRRDGGSIVFVGSQIVRRVFAGRGSYASSKAALLTAAQVLAREVGPYDIRVNTVVPGRMWGAPLQSGIGRLAASRGMTVEEQYQRMLDDVSLPDLATDEECSRVVLFLLSDLSAALTGQSVDAKRGGDVPLSDTQRITPAGRSPYTRQPEKKRTTARKPRTMDSEARWEEIVHAAASIFYKKGYEATSLQDIASAVGLLKGSIYYYIKTKEDLLYELVNRAQILYLGTLEEDAELAAGPAPERLKSFIRRWMALTAKDREWGLVAEREFSRLSPRRLKVVIGRRDTYSNFVKDIIAQGVAEGAFEPGVDTSIATTAIFELMLSSHQWHRPTGRLSLVDIGEWYATFVVRGLGGPEWSQSQSERRQA